METRVHYAKVAPGIYEAVLGLMATFARAGWTNRS
jgi:hypothetical protein